MNTLIVGATGGLGQALAKGLSSKASKLWLSGRNGQILAGMGLEFGAETLQADLASELELQSLCEEAGALDLLIYAAGAVSKGSLRETSSRDLERLANANQNGFALLLKHARFSPNATVVMLGVYPDFVTVPGMSAYAASKLGAETVLKVARKEFRREGTRFVLVRLPAVATDLWLPMGGAPKTAMSAEVAAEKILEGILVEQPPEVLEIK